MGETEEVETPRLFKPLRSPRLHLPVGPFETHQPGLVRVEAKAISVESLRQYLQHPPSIALQLEDQDEVVCEADQTRRPVQPRLDLGLKPLVQYLVEVDVRQQRR